VVTSVGKLEYSTLSVLTVICGLSVNVDCSVIILKCCSVTTDGGVDVVVCIFQTSAFDGFVDRY
jgi:hypothetical protein